MGKTAFPDANRKDTFYLPPEAFTIITDPAHELFDERALEPFSESLVRSIMAQGQLQPITVRRNGKDEAGSNIIEVIIGRGRVKAILEANNRLASVGKPPMKVHFQHIDMSDEKDLLKNIIAENEIRVPDSPSIRARKLNDLIKKGASEAEAATAFGVSVMECKKLMKLMALCKEATDAIDDGKLSISAASKLVGLSRAEQKKLLESLTAGGGKITAERIEESKAAQPGADGGIPAPKKPKCKSRAQIEETLGRLVADVGYGGNEDKRAGMIVSLQWVLGEMEEVG